MKRPQFKITTIRMKMTLWYAFFMLILLLISFLVIYHLTQKSRTTNQRENLIDIVTDGTNEIKDLEDYEYYHYGVYMQVYDKNGTYVAGIVPDELPVNLPIQRNRLQTVQTEEEDFFVYDKEFNLLSEQYLLRGAAPQSERDMLGWLIVSFITIVLPIFVMVACLFGYFLTKKAFRPVMKIQETAQSIADSNELSLRIGINEGDDEIARLGKTVDHMLDKLQRSFEKEKQFTSDVSHELRTPITVILMESEYLLEDTYSLEEVKESAQVISKQADRMSGLINQLLFFARSDSDSFLLNQEEMDAAAVVTELVDEYKPMAEHEGLTIEMHNHVKGDVYLIADKTLFIRCLYNLIGNAIHYGREKGRIEVALYRHQNELVVSVTDDGIGIQEEHLEKIWDRFYQVDDSRNKKNGNSMGLGLSMVKTIVEKHGGHVTVDSTFGEGSTFRMFFAFTRQTK